MGCDEQSRTLSADRSRSRRAARFGMTAELLYFRQREDSMMSPRTEQRVALRCERSAENV